MFRHSTNHQDQLRYDEDMGPEAVQTSAKSKRAAKAINDLRKGDDKQTRKAAETVTRVMPILDFFDSETETQYGQSHSEYK